MDGGCRLWRGAVSTKDDLLIAGRSLNVTAVDQQPIAVVSAGRRAPFSARDVGPRPARVLVDVRLSTADDSPAAAQPFRQFVPCFFMANLRGGFTHKTDELGAVLRETQDTAIAVDDVTLSSTWTKFSLAAAKTADTDIALIREWMIEDMDVETEK